RGGHAMPLRCAPSHSTKHAPVAQAAPRMKHLRSMHAVQQASSMPLRRQVVIDFLASPFAKIALGRPFATRLSRTESVAIATTRGMVVALPITRKSTRGGIPMRHIALSCGFLLAVAGCVTTTGPTNETGA